MLPHLSNLDLETLRKLANGEAVSMSSDLRLRLELAGAIRDAAKGVILTAEGHRLARQKTVHVTLDGATPDDKTALDRRGRRMPNRRKSIF